MDYRPLAGAPGKAVNRGYLPQSRGL